MLTREAYTIILYAIDAYSQLHAEYARKTDETLNSELPAVCEGERWIKTRNDFRLLTTACRPATTCFRRANDNTQARTICSCRRRRLFAEKCTCTKMRHRHRRRGNDICVSFLSHLPQLQHRQTGQAVDVQSLRHSIRATLWWKTQVGGKSTQTN